MSSSNERRILILFGIAVLVLVGSLLYRLWTTTTEDNNSTPVAVARSSELYIQQLQTRLQSNPENADLYAELGLAYLQRVRENNDPNLYLQAELALTESLQRNTQQQNALLGQGLLALARHDFGAALEWGKQLQALNPYKAEALGVMVDAYVELGQYEQAVATAQAMVDLRPNLASYTRVSYLRELHGNVEGAIMAMEQAVQAGVPGQEETLWTLVQLGNLHFNRGDWERAQKVYEEALFAQEDYVYALAGIAKVQAARGEYEQAIVIYESLVNRLPVVEFVVALGELYEVTDKLAEAEKQYELVGVIQQLNESAGMNVDLELALFNADHQINPTQTVQQAQAAYERRPSVHAADVLAWALYQNGEYATAWERSQEALRLGTQDGLMYYHAGMIAHALGNIPTAIQHLQQALTINPAFSIRYAPHAQQLVQQLQ